MKVPWWLFRAAQECAAHGVAGCLSTLPSTYTIYCIKILGVYIYIICIYIYVLNMNVTTQSIHIYIYIYSIYIYMHINKHAFKLYPLRPTKHQ